ncbi:MAG: isoprenylcysteine carboxylmethyltransferase family protein [Blastocatellia bacterium]
MTFRGFAQRIRVPAGFVLAPLLFIAARPTPGSLLTGASVAVIGLAIRAWASGYLRKNEELTVTGPYAHTRNPLYVGTFLLGTGVAISAGTFWFTALFMALYLFIYLPVMFAEAEAMLQLFPNDYEDYRKRVPLFHMRLTPYRRAAGRQTLAASERAGSRFDSSLYLRHREYRAAFGLLGVYALLTVKLVLL